MSDREVSDMSYEDNDDCSYSPRMDKDDEDIMDIDNSKPKMEKKHASDYNQLMDKDNNEWTLNSQAMTEIMVKKLIRCDTEDYRGIPFLILPARDSKSNAITYYLNFKGFRSSDITRERIVYIITDTVKFWEKMRFKECGWKFTLKRKKWDPKTKAFYSNKYINKDVTDGSVCDWIVPRDIMNNSISIHVTSPLSRARISNCNNASKQSNNAHKMGRKSRTAAVRNKDEMTKKLKWCSNFKQWFTDHKKYSKFSDFLEDDRVHGTLWICAQTAIHDDDYTNDKAATTIKRKILQEINGVENKNPNEGSYDDRSKTDRSKFRITKKKLSILNEPFNLERAPSSSSDSEPILSRIHQLETEVAMQRDCIDEIQRVMPDIFSTLTLFYVMLLSLLKAGNHIKAESILIDGFKKSVFDHDVVQKIFDDNNILCRQKIKAENEQKEIPVPSKDVKKEHVMQNILNTNNNQKIEIIDLDSNEVDGWYCRDCHRINELQSVTCTHCKPYVCVKQEKDIEMPELSQPQIELSQPQSAPKQEPGNPLLLLDNLQKDFFNDMNKISDI